MDVYKYFFKDIQDWIFFKEKQDGICEFVLIIFFKDIQDYNYVPPFFLNYLIKE